MFNHLDNEVLPMEITRKFLGNLSIDFDNHTDVIKTVKLLREICDIYAVISLSEKEQTLAGKIRTICKVEGISYKDSFYFRDKVLMKQKIRTLNIKSPAFTPLDKTKISKAIEFFNTHRRVVFKPRAATGSMDTIIVNSEKQLRDLCDKYFEILENYYIEEYISGEMYSVDSVISEGTVVFSGIMKYQSSTLNFQNRRNVFSCITPAEGELTNKIRKYTQKIIEFFRITKGTTHLEIFVTSTNDIIFCEIASRPGGGYIIEALENSYGLNMYEAAMRSELNEPIIFNEQESKYSGFIMFNHSEGTIADLSYPNIEEYKWILMHEVFAKVGDTTSRSKYITDCLASFLIESPTYSQLIERLNFLESNFKVSYY
ncbi:ATP-grasp domain-containing protein [Cytobacillus firmus]|uniref:ATP-grasp domain-containing protein n=1 Tax=Cytobacillus firmus TaxID=1399 RepID=UPI003001F1D6